MDLFVVNRHTENEEQPKEIDEAKNITRLLKRTEKRKHRKEEAQRRQLEVTARRKFKRAIKDQIVTLPEGDNEFIDENIPQSQIAVQETSVTGEEKKSKRKKQKTDPNSVEGFTILGDKNFLKKSKVKRVLPKWLTNPTVISVNLQNLDTKVSSFKVLDKSIRSKLKANGVEYLFPVQTQVIPWLLKCYQNSKVIFPRDTCVSAPTGSGKTLAFVLPIVQVLKDHSMKKIRALIILPTQDLAEQVYSTFKTYTEGTKLEVCIVTGKNSFTAEQKFLVTENPLFGYLSKVDILVCTAGRLVEHLKETKGFDLQYLEYLVIDEADRVLDNVQNDWLYHLEKQIPGMQSSKILNLETLKGRKPPQKLLFSATLSQDPEKLQKLSLFQPKLFTSVVESDKTPDNETEQTDKFIGKYTTPKELIEKYILCKTDIKPLVLYRFIKKEKLTKTIVFTHCVDSTHRLAVLLKSLSKNKLNVQEISSHLDGNLRKNILKEFSEGNIDILVCTDALARGMDLKGVQCVISYSPPKHLKTYIHRAGRTARAGETGLAVTMLQEEHVSRFLNMLQEAGKTGLDQIIVPENKLEKLEETYREALANLKEHVSKEQDINLKKIKLAKGLSVKKRKRENSHSENSD